MGIAERKEREKLQRKNEIIEAAEKVFFSRGIEKATMDEVAEEAELSKGTLYLYFKSKEDLHMSVALKAISLLGEMTRGIRELKETAIDKLVSMGRACISFAESHPDHMRAIITLEGFELHHISYSVSEMQEMIYQDSPVGMVIEIVKQGVEEGSIRSDIPAELIGHTLWMQLISVIHFVARKRVLFDMLDLTPGEVYESHFNLVLNGIRNEG